MEQTAETLARLVGEQQGLLAELLALAEREYDCCTGEALDELPEIVAQRAEVLSACQAVHAEAAELVQLMRRNGWPVPPAVQQTAQNTSQVISAIEAIDDRSRQLLEELMLRRIATLNQINTGSRLLRAFKTEPDVISIAHSSRE